jgi:hypothetical protein
MRRAIQPLKVELEPSGIARTNIAFTDLPGAVKARLAAAPAAVAKRVRATCIVGARPYFAPHVPPFEGQHHHA